MVRFLIATTFVLSSCLPSVAQAQRSSVVIPAGMQINMFVVSDVSATSLHPGDVFAAEAASNVFVNGTLVVRKGAEGLGRINKALRLSFDWVYAADGTKVVLAESEPGIGRKARWDEADTTSSLATFGLAGYFGITRAFAKYDVDVNVNNERAR